MARGIRMGGSSSSSKAKLELVSKNTNVVTSDSLVDNILTVNLKMNDIWGAVSPITVFSFYCSTDCAVLIQNIANGSYSALNYRIINQDGTAVYSGRGATTKSLPKGLYTFQETTSVSNALTINSNIIKIYPL